MSDAMDNDHWIIGQAEAAALRPTGWERWIGAAEALLGHSADGDQRADGYSMDWFYDQWKAGATPSDAVNALAGVITDRQDR
ncbi:hypothetical protein [Nocardia amamiensis]|uniref:hypothetical protein n=1 Tax=Nocardia amamiensis TaxID=404578 RepID=UPI001FDF0DC7|nr:hypothetical protein [Nocardia amamiensis]